MQAPAVLRCQYASWYREFGHLAFRSKLIELPQGFIDFLLQDGVFLSESSSAVSISQSHMFPIYVIHIHAYRRMRVMRQSSPYTLTCHSCQGEQR